MNPRRLERYLVSAAFLDLFGFGLVVPLLPLVAEKAGIPGWAASASFTVTALAQFAALPLLTTLSDRRGRRFVILLSLVGNAASMLLLAWSLASASVAGLLVARLVAGLVAGNLATLQAVVADGWNASDRPRILGRFGAAMGLGFAAGPVAGGLCAKAGLVVPALASASIALLGAALASRVLASGAAPRVARESVADRPVLDRTLLAACGIAFTTFFATALLQAAMPLLAPHALGWDERDAGWAFGVFGAVTIAVQGGAIGPLSRRVPLSALAASGLALVALGLVSLHFSTGSVPALVALSFVGAGHGLASPASTALATRSSASSARPLGWQQALAVLGRVLGPVSGTALAQAAPTSTWSSAALATASLGTLFALATRFVPASASVTHAADHSEPPVEEPRPSARLG